MDSKTFHNQLAKKLGRGYDETVTLTDALGKIMSEIGGEFDSVAVPGFGTFTTTKTDEKIVTDDVTGQRTLIPPCISMSFTPSVVLRKKMLK